MHFEEMVCEAALYFLDGQYLFRHRNSQGAVTSKYITNESLVAAFSQTEQDSGWLPAGVVRVGHNQHGPWFVYSTPEQKIDITVYPTESLTIPLPRLVMLAGGKGVYFWATGSKFFDYDAEGFSAPFPNLYSDGKVCWGGNLVPEIAAENARKIWQKFFGSLFNQDLSVRKCKGHDENVLDLLRELSVENKRRFPKREMISECRTISQLVNGVLNVR